MRVSCMVYVFPCADFLRKRAQTHIRQMRIRTQTLSDWRFFDRMSIRADNLGRFVAYESAISFCSSDNEWDIIMFIIYLHDIQVMKIRNYKAFCKSCTGFINESHHNLLIIF